MTFEEWVSSNKERIESCLRHNDQESWMLLLGMAFLMGEAAGAKAMLTLVSFAGVAGDLHEEMRELLKGG